MTDPKKKSYLSSRANASFFLSGEGNLAQLVSINLDHNERTDSSDVSLEHTDLQLANWEKWLKIHKTQQDKLSSKLKRKPECLLMNSVFNSLHVNQDKNRITEAIKYVNFDKYRGHPNYWEFNANFERCGEPLAVYKTIQNRYDRSRPMDNAEHPHSPKLTEREYVGIPEGIYKEKGLSGPYSPSSRKKWDESQYVMRSKRILKEKLEKVMPYTPDVTVLMVLGKKCSKPDSQTIDSSIYCGSNSEIGLSLHSTSPEIDTNTKSKETLMNVKIGGIDLAAGSNVWRVSFDECILNERYKVLVTVNNAEETVIRYSWQFVCPKWVDNVLPLKLLKKKSKCFYFDKSDGVILPAREQKLIFHFISTSPGVFHETWILQYSHSPDQWSYITVGLSAVAVEQENCNDNIMEIYSYLESCTRYTIARKTIQGMLEINKPNIPGELPYDWRFFEEEIFRYNNPELYYDSMCVCDLKKLHQNITKGPWDYSIKVLREKIMQKSLDGDIKNEIELFSSIVSKLLKQNVPLTLPNEKTKSVYELLCCFINKLDDEGQQLKILYKIPIMFNLHHDFDSHIISGSLQSSKFSLKGIKLTHKHSTKKVLPKAKSSFIVSRNNIAIHKSSETFSMRSTATSNSVMSLLEDENHINNRRQEYFDTLYIKTYHYLCQTVEQISLVMDSFDLQKKRTAQNALKNRNL